MSKIEPKPEALATLEPSAVGQSMQLAETLAKSDLIPRALKGKPGDVLVVLLTGRELGLGPMQSLRGIHVVDGKAVMAADLIVGLCARERSVCEWFRLVESTDSSAVYETKRAGHPEPVRLAFTIEQARQAKLAGKQNWQNYPAAMLRARCASGLARAVYPDLMAGVYDPDELDVTPVRPVAEPIPIQARREPEATKAPPIVEVETQSLPFAPPVEATPTPPPPVAAPPPDRKEQLAIAIGECSNAKELRAVGQRIKTALERGEITNADREELGGLYGAKQQDLRRARP